MNRTRTLLTLLCALAIPVTALADGEPCAGNMADYDEDGVMNDADSDEFDSCQLDPNGTGDADCTTGAGDGLPDVRICG